MRRFQTWPVIGLMWALSLGFVGLGATRVVPALGSRVVLSDVGPTAVVWVARREIPAGRELSGRDVRLTEWPERHLPEQVATEDIVGRVALSPIYSGEVVRAERLGPAPAKEGRR